MAAWRRAEHVSRWWHETTDEDVATDCAAVIAGGEPEHPFIILLGERPIGYIQWYHLWNDGVAITPSYAQLSPAIPRSAVGIDLFIGEADCLYRGLGPRILRRLMREQIFTDPAVAGCFIDPDPANASAIRAYEKAGFRHVRTIWVEEESEQVYVMYVAREEELGED